VDKLTDFLRSFVGSHLRRFEGSTLFPVLEFLALLYKYTFLQTKPESLFACLETWTIFADYISTSLANRKADGMRMLQRYSEALLSLVAELVSRIQLRANRQQIEQLDDTTVDDDVRK
jgi:hypothetical protein